MLSQEELVAEIGSALLCADMEIALEPREDNSSYIDYWLEVLQNVSRAIFTAGRPRIPRPIVHPQVQLKLSAIVVHFGGMHRSFMNRSGRCLAPALLSAVMLFTGVAQAMQIQQFDKMAF